MMVPLGPNLTLISMLLGQLTHVHTHIDVHACTRKHTHKHTCSYNSVNHSTVLFVWLKAGALL